MSIEKINEMYVPTCDTCGEMLSDEYTYDDAVTSMKDEGWSTKRTHFGWENCCPSCAAGGK